MATSIELENEAPTKLMDFRRATEAAKLEAAKCFILSAVLPSFRLPDQKKSYQDWQDSVFLHKIHYTGLPDFNLQHAYQWLSTVTPEQAAIFPQAGANAHEQTYWELMEIGTIIYQGLLATPPAE